MFTFATVVMASVPSCSGNQDMQDNKKYNKLTEEEEEIILHKGTEAPFTGKYNDFSENGAYLCKRCHAKLYTSNDKFQSTCGWPSFDDEIAGAVRRQTDADGKRTEILCANCGAHLGHVFKGEHLTDKNVRHCVNSLSLKFIPAADSAATKKAYFAGGCFWGVEYLFEHKDGVTSAASGYMGGTTDNPSYEDVCKKNTGHLEVVEVTYNPAKVSFEELTKFFFEIHDPTQDNGQGPDIGNQYLSAVFVSDEAEKKTAEKLIEILKKKEYEIATKIRPVETFWKAEDYHQDYYDKHHKQPYCHSYTKRF
jgi:peptide methionine sulfoxide reductase msrA/msrB